MLVHFMSSSVLHPEENKRVAPVELCPILKTLYKILTRRELPTHGILQALRDEMMNDPRDRKEMLSWLKRIQLAGLDLYIYRRAGDRKLSSCLQTMDSLQILQVISFGLLVSIFARLSGANGIGINYGMLGDNLPTPDEAIALYKSRNITNLRLFNPNSTVLTAAENSGIGVVLGTYNQDLQNLATNPSFATQWVETNVAPFAKSVNFRYVTAGNEVIPGDLATYVLPAIKNLDSALKDANLHIPVSTAVSGQVLNMSYPPSQGSFSSLSTIAPLVAYLEASGAPLLVNLYSYFAYAGNSEDVKLDYALFTANDTVVQDGKLGYTNLFDAMVDAVYSALEKAGRSGVEVVVSETGWPSGGNGIGATEENARLYNNNLVAHLNKNVGTPKRPGKAIETYLFAMFNENQKPAGTEQNFGLYHPDMTEVYHVNFSP